MRCGVSGMVYWVNTYYFMSHYLNFGDSPQRFLVTGGTGFIGSALCLALLSEGHNITVLSRAPARVKALFGDKARGIQRFSELAPKENFDIVINLAGEPIIGPRWTQARKAVLQSSRCDITRSLVDWIARAQSRPRLMISGSAIGYYGTQEAGRPDSLSEDGPPSDIYMSEICQAWENSAIPVQRLGVTLAILRLGVVLGPIGGGQGALPKMILPVRFGLSGCLGDGQQVVSWVHLADVLGAISHVMRLPNVEAQGKFNLTAPEPVSQREFMRIAAQVMQRRWILPIATPARLVEVLLGEQASLVLQGQRVVPTRLLKTGYSFAFPTLSQAMKNCLET